MATWCKPKVCIQRTSYYLNKCVNSWAITVFAIFEFWVAVWLYLFAYLFSDVLGNVWGFPTWISSRLNGWSQVDVLVFIAYVLLLGRMLSAMVGATAAWNRRVLRMRLYWMLLIFNTVMMLPIYVPIRNTSCTCKHDLSGFMDDPKQCLAVRAFEWMLQPQPRRLGSDYTRAHLQLESRLATLQKDLQMQQRFVEPPLDTPLRRLQFRWDEDEPQNLLSEMLTRFNVTDAGIEFAFEPAAALDLNGHCSRPYDLEGQDPVDQGLTLRSLQCGRKQFDQDDDFSKDHENIREALQECLNTDRCAGVSVRFEPVSEPATVMTPFLLQTCGLTYDTAVPRLEQEALQEAIECERASWNCNPEPAQLNPERCGGCTVNFVRKVERRVIDQAPQTAFAFCTIISAFTLLLLCMVQCISFPMMVVVFKFVKTGCGDAFELGDVQPTIGSVNSHTTDDFAVGTFVSRDSVQASTLCATTDQTMSGRNSMLSNKDSLCSRGATVTPKGTSPHVFGGPNGTGQAIRLSGKTASVEVSNIGCQPEVTTSESNPVVSVATWNTGDGDFVSFDFEETPSTPMIFKESSLASVEFDTKKEVELVKRKEEMELGKRK